MSGWVYDYNAFISYSHAADVRLASALRKALQRFALPWAPLRLSNPVRSIRVFQDSAALPANPELWPRIERALLASEYLILLASPDASRSPWVAKELDVWCRHKHADHILVVLTSGDIVWSHQNNDFHWGKTTALPQSLSHVFPNEPLWLDLRWAQTVAHASMSDPRFRECVAELTSSLRGLSKDEVIGEDIRQLRVLNRWRNIALGVVSALTALTIAFGLISTGKLLSVGKDPMPGDSPSIERIQVLKPAMEREYSFELVLANPLDHSVLVEKLIVSGKYDSGLACKADSFFIAMQVNFEYQASDPDAASMKRTADYQIDGTGTTSAVNRGAYPVVGRMSENCSDLDLQVEIPATIILQPNSRNLIEIVLEEGKYSSGLKVPGGRHFGDFEFVNRRFQENWFKKHPNEAVIPETEKKYLANLAHLFILKREELPSDFQEDRRLLENIDNWTFNFILADEKGTMHIDIVTDNR